MRSKTKDNIELLYTNSNESISLESKITFNYFVKLVWKISKTNLHYIDFKNIHKDSLKRMYNPEKITPFVSEENIPEYTTNCKRKDIPKLEFNILSIANRDVVVENKEDGSNLSRLSILRELKIEKDYLGLIKGEIVSQVSTPIGAPNRILIYVIKGTKVIGVPLNYILQ
jgi:hypothetical protein